MNWHEMIAYVAAQWQQVSWMEKTAVSFGIVEVLLSYRNNVLLYPAGIISCCLSIFLLAESKLYAESGLNIYYLVMSIWGWTQWVKRSRNNEQLPISRAGSKDWAAVSAICVCGFAVIYGVLRGFTDSTTPLMDAFVSATAWAGMYLLARRKVENWVLLNVSNIVAIPLLFHKGLFLYALLTIVLFTVACFGYFKWLRLLKAGTGGSGSRPEEDEWLEHRPGKHPAANQH